jgi:ribose transport system ATP-binding protein
VLAVRNLSAKGGRFANVTFDVRKGEVLGIAGLVGAGRTGLVRSLTGADPIGSGSVHLHGEDVTPGRPSDAIRRGIVLVPEDRRRQGLVLSHSLGENVGYANLSAIATRGLVAPRRLMQFADTHLQRLGVKGHGTQPAGELSGGNQQKVVLAKWLARMPEVVVLDEPTRGIDVGARAWIYEMIAGLASRGKAVIMVSSDLEEILGLSHRILVMSRGRQAGLLDRHEATGVSIMELATSTAMRTETCSPSH